MRLKSICFLLFLSLVLFCKAQNNSDDILFTVDEEAVPVSEFLRVYNKNLDLVKDESQKDVETYLNLFVNYKLKLREARALQLDKKPSYIRELSTYKSQLAKNYVTDNKVTDKLVVEAYERVSNEVDASHILIKMDEGASPADTLVVYNEILEIRQRALNEGFEKVKKEYMNGSGRILAEDLGYFSGFKMVYAFENVAFNTNVGEVSMPFKTRFGYHILKVLNKRKSRGKRTVAHIMLTEKQEDTVNNPKIKIREIYTKINQGESFEALAKQFSEDKSSASKGGRLTPFSGGQLSAPKFEEMAFSMENINDVSQPFKSKYGWHVIKLLEKQPVKPFEQLKPELVAKVKRDSRSKIIDNALSETLKKRYNVSSEQPALDYFKSILNNNYHQRTWGIPEDFPNEKILLTIGNKQIRYRDFANHLVKSQRIPSKRKPLNLIVEEQYDSFLSTSLKNYQEENLEFENKDFANILNEYRDGLLLFDLMESTIWNLGKTDSVGLKKFYDKHQGNYFFRESVDAIVASSAKQKVIKKVAKLLDKGLSLEEIKGLVNSKDNIDVLFSQEKMDREHQALPKGVPFVKGISKIYKHNDGFVVVKINEVVQQKPKSFDEAKGNVISDFQDYEEQKWIEELKAKYKVNIDQSVLDKVKNQVNN